MFLDGWKTYIVIVMMAVYNIMVQAGWLGDVSEADWQIFVNVVLAILGMIFNKIGRNKIAKYGK